MQCSSSTRQNWSARSSLPSCAEECAQLLLEASARFIGPQLDLLISAKKGCQVLAVWGRATSTLALETAFMQHLLCA